MTDTVDLGALTYSEGYFLLRDRAVHREPYVPEPQDAGQAYRHVFTYGGSRPVIKEAALELLASARRKVFLASFRVGEPDLLEALYAAAARLRGGVYVISALDEKSLRKGLRIEAADAPDAADIRSQNKRFEDMTSRGIAVRGHESCHAKLLVVDDRVALVSSANLETSALVDRRERDATGESGAVVSEPEEVARLSRFFTRLWYACPFEMPPGEDHTVQERAPVPSPCRVPVPGVASRAGVIWTYDDERGILETIHDVIGRARERLLLTTFGLNGVAERRELLLDPLERALDAHPLQVSLLARARNNLETHRRDAEALAGLGVSIHADSLNHAKAAIADERHGALFSANFDAQHGLLSGVEVGVRLDGQPALKEAVRYFDHAIANADLAFVARPTQREMNERLGASWRARWPFETDLLVTVPNRTWERFRSAAASPPVLYECEGNEKIRLYAGEGEWTLGPRSSDGARRLEQAGGGTSGGAIRLLSSWLSPPRGKKGEPGSRTRRGFCPALIQRAPSS
jgi:phosphatidylserine/phosphatidylglycerophosphate/cardiolipin synthase-like enzyme